MAVKKRKTSYSRPYSPIMRKNGEVRSPGGSTTHTGYQITDSIGHPIDKKTGNRVGGGPFSTTKSYEEVKTASVRLDSNEGSKDGFIYDGPICTPRPNTSSASPKNSEAKLSTWTTDNASESLDEFGATAISLCSPTNPTSNLGVALGEILREGIPALPGIKTWKHRTSLAKDAGSEYLNHQFGWLPLVSEMKNVGNSVRHSRDIVSQYHRDSGNNIRRRFELSPEITTSTTDHGSGWRAARGCMISSDSTFANIFSSGGPSPRLTSTTRVVKRRWFVGSFTYAMPTSSDKWRRLLGAGSDADKLFGIALTPDIVWELTPWSWAVDWFSNTGDVIHNLTNFAQYGLVMRYGYVMSETTATTTYSLSGSGLKGHSAAPPPRRVITVSKRRAEANPFGFGIGWEDLSPTQLAITAALGITKLR